MKHVIIGIHGLSNKPPENDLHDGWLSAIMEGLKKNSGVDQQDFDLELFYWSPHRYEEPSEGNEPYRPHPDDTLPPGKPGWRSDLRDGLGQFVSDQLTRLPGANWIRRKIRRRYVKDLDAYYGDENSVHPDYRDQKFGPLIKRLFREQIEAHPEDKIMVIAHSMGSIVAFDALVDLADSGIAVTDFVTIGSPLGFDLVRDKIKEEGHTLNTPAVVTERWSNYADRRDWVAFNWRLENWYSRNNMGVGVDSEIVRNTYRGSDDGANPHKSYGYLRTPEVSQHIRNFMSRGGQG